ncbi:MAG: hypothetical protein AAF982_09160 [Pseudomonadota bacterium]
MTAGHADRFTALIDACALGGALRRNMLLSLAEAGLFRPRWSARILDEIQKAISEITKGAKHVSSQAYDHAMPATTGRRDRIAKVRGFGIATA